MNKQTDDREAAEIAPTVRQSELIDALGTWQPIETAPKDGTSILGWFPTVDGTHRMWWNGRHLKAYGSGWIYGNGSGVELPTHWMPLPAPPEST